MARLHVGTATTLAAVPTASCSNGDIAYIWLNGYTRKMIYNSTATYATDTSNHPYKQRPSDYGAAGVWVEDIGADQPEVWSMDQIKTGELIIADDGSIHTDSKTSYADTDAGFGLGMIPLRTKLILAMLIPILNGVGLPWLLKWPLERHLIYMGV